jgi:predicted TIM-barrel fold metal-dependent hydrolase
MDFDSHQPILRLLFWLGPDKLCFGSDYAIWK